jgi:hypothetical protein
MNLETFISNSLVSIQRGVESANKELQGGNKTPPFLIGFSGLSAEEEKSIEFDVAVTINQEVSGGAGGEINVVGIKLGGKLDTQGGHESISRVRFKIHPNYAIG